MEGSMIALVVIPLETARAEPVRSEKGAAFTPLCFCLLRIIRIFQRHEGWIIRANLLMDVTGLEKMTVR